MSKLYVIKRDGKVVDFDLSKISTAMEKAFKATDSLCVDDLLQLLSMRVVSTLSPMVKDNKIHVEDIQDCVEKVLCEAGFINVARAYIRYRHQHENIRNATGTLLDYKSVVDDYLKVLDWRVKENSTVTYSLGGLILSNSGAITANYWLSEIYDQEIADAHRSAAIHIHDLSMLSGYCAGWSLRQLIQEGLGGVPGKINSKPASHLSTLCNQMVNFLGILQNEWAGAQAFSSFDTYLAPFVKVDNLSYKETKQCIQSFVYGVNTPSRWGCVDPATELLTVDGFKHYQELKKGEPIYTWHDGKLEIQPLNEIIVKEHHGVMHNYRSHRTGYHQMVTPEHRVVLMDRDNKTVSMIRHSSDIFGAHEDLYMPIQFQTANLEGEFFGNEAFCDDMLDDINIGKLSSDSARYIINQATDDHGIAHIDAKYVNAFQQIALIAGYTSFVTLSSEYVDITTGTVDIQVRNQGANYTVIHDTVTNRYESPYDGTVWCPNVDNGVVVFRRYGNVFISGNCQSPFSNITLDWVCPPDMKDMPAIVGGKEMDFTYGDCKKEMDMVNKAFIEIMIEGDANGRGFQYPIPTYSITRDFDWSDTENNRLLFEMTAKYGTPYFSNYINSDMEPSDVRSMCPLTPDTKVLVRSEENGVRIAPIYEIYRGVVNHGTHYDVWTPNGWRCGKPNRQPVTKVYSIRLSNGSVVNMGENHLQVTKDNGTLSAKDLKVGMWIPFNKDPIVNNSSVGSYELGYIVGTYAGDGSHDKNRITYTICGGEKSDLVETSLRTIWEDLGFRVKVTNDGSVRFITVSSGAYDIIKKYIKGSNALTKHFTNAVYDGSEKFRQGILDGYAATDGSRDKKRLYTSSAAMREDLQMIFNSVGHKALINNVDNREGRLGTNPNYRVDYPERDAYGDLYLTDDSFIYYSIVEINEIDYTGDYLYCFEVDSDDHIFMLANGMYTHNCRLRLDLRELRKKSGGFFGSGESTGSVGVVTINLPRIAYQAYNEQDFYERLDKLMDIAARSLKIKREVISKFLDAGLYPYTKRYLGTFANHFSTIGLVGMNEAGLNARWLRKDLTHEETQKFAKDVLNHMRERLSDYQEQYGDLYNLEATPAESTSYRFAKHDKQDFPDIITANEHGTPYYTNSSHLPVGYTKDIFSALDVQDELQTLYTSGTVFHAFLGEKLPNWEAAAKLVRKIAENYKLPYYTMSPTYSVCPDCGYITGEQYTCPKCGKKTEVYSRITGYYRPVQNWNDGKTQEFKDRQTYDVDNSVLTHQGPIEDQGFEKAVERAEESLKTDEPNCILFTTSTCPKCPIAKKILENAKIPYTLVVADKEPEKAKEYGIRQAPTLICKTIDGEKVTVSGLSEIKDFIHRLRKLAD